MIAAMDSPDPFADVSVAQAAALLAEPGVRLLDVRSRPENDALRIPAEQLVLNVYDPEFQTALAELPRDARWVVYCRTGNRSGFAVDMMRRLGFGEAHNVAGGIKAWDEAGLPTESTAPEV